MSTRATSLFYALSAFVLFMALFVMKPSDVSEVALLQEEMQSQFSVAFQQTIGDQPYFEEILLVIDGVTNFYTLAADSSIALYEDKQADAELAFIFGATYEKLVSVVSSYVKSANSATIAQEEPQLTVPVADLAITEPVEDSFGVVSGALLDVLPVNLEKPWVTIQDNSTGQLYCLAIYNGEVNKYLGSCKDDYH